MYAKRGGDGRDQRRRRQLNVDNSATARVGMSAICFYVVFGEVVGHVVAFALGSWSVIFVILLLCAWSGCRQLALAVVAPARIASGGCTILSLGVRRNRLLFGSCVGCTILSLGVRRI